MSSSESIQPGVLYVIATPIGNLLDITQRALQILAAVDCIAAEDTRHSRHLLRHYQINTRLLALHEHNESNQTTVILQLLQTQQSVALISDAGTPLISDPGYRLVKAAHEVGIKVVPIPGPCALIAALSASGLPTDRFIFEGFLPVKSGARLSRLQSLSNEFRTLIFYEAPHRMVDLLTQLLSVFEPERPLVIARELTKHFETIYATTLQQGLAWIQADPQQQLGEFVVIVGGKIASTQQDAIPQEAMQTLKILLSELPQSQAVELTAKITGEKKNKLYKVALEISK